MDQSVSQSFRLRSRTARVYDAYGLNIACVVSYQFIKVFRRRRPPVRPALCCRVKLLHRGETLYGAAGRAGGRLQAVITIAQQRYR